MAGVKRRRKSDAPPRQQPAKVKREPQPRPAPTKSVRNERTSKPVRRQIDPTGKIAKAIMEFCNELGYPVAEVYQQFVWFALCREFELKVPRAAAEEAAWRDLKLCLDKRGEIEPS